MVDFNTLLKRLENCDICPQNCHINRKFKLGYCKVNDKIKINLWQKHFGEEPLISGTNGSGTIFFSGCNLSCVYCQNYKISQYAFGKDYTIDEVSQIMLNLQTENVHNINLVTPTHFSVQLLLSIKNALEKGLNIPIVWNTSSYEKVEILQKLNGYVDIYLADIRYFDFKNSLRYSKVKDYPIISQQAILEMYRQVGDIILDKNGIAQSGLLIRILVLPNSSNDIENILKWIKTNIGNKIYISLMSQYYPTFKADKFKELDRGLNINEYEKAKEILYKYGFENGFLQKPNQTPDWTPKFREN